MSLWFTARIPFDQGRSYIAGTYFDCWGKKFTYIRQKEQMIIFLAPKNSQAIEYLWGLFREQFPNCDFKLEEKHQLDDVIQTNLRKRTGFIYTD